MHNVLVIDDEADVRDGIQRVLERSGFSVRTVDNVSQAISELKNTHTDVVITDIIMPKQSGMDAIEFILREFPTTRIVAISGGGNFDVAGYQPSAITTSAYLAAAKKAGAHVILTKPFESSELIGAVKQAIGAGHA
jgi:DNA-binding NtrC family response regulator